VAGTMTKGGVPVGTFAQLQMAAPVSEVTYNMEGMWPARSANKSDDNDHWRTTIPVAVFITALISVIIGYMIAGWEHKRAAENLASEDTSSLAAKLAAVLPSIVQAQATKWNTGIQVFQPFPFTSNHQLTLGNRLSLTSQSTLSSTIRLASIMQLQAIALPLV